MENRELLETLAQKLYACELVSKRWFVPEEDLPLYWELIDELLTPTGRHPFAEIRATADALFVRDTEV